MQFLDAIGLASFWEKIKNWANSNFFSKRGGEIHPKTGLQYTIDGEQLSITKSGEENETIYIFNVDENRMEAIAIVKSGGTATQVLMADGSVKTLNASNGIAGLDSKGNVPLSQLGNLDTTYTKKSENIQNVNVNPDTTSNRNGVELEFTNVDDDPIFYGYIPEVTTMSCGVMNEYDKLKLDEIDSRATADSAIPTSVIDALK